MLHRQTRSAGTERRSSESALPARAAPCTEQLRAGSRSAEAVGRLLVRRFVTPDRRYGRLGGSLLRLRRAEHRAFARHLVQAAYEITPGDRSLGPMARRPAVRASGP
ncbi:DUF6000 family protein [Streptomyces sp. WM6372]|uniref:DUF6000 family protein n=1 Tax=Streptomyces sp. WM6372 TaxID=1415555 RepID=UPI003B63CB55